MSDGYRDPLSSSADDHNPFAAPAEVGDVATVDNELATLGARWLGAFVDGLLLLPAMGLIFFFAFRMAVTDPDYANSLVQQFIASIVSAVVITLWYLLLNGYLLATRGQSIGKIAAGTRIVDVDTNEIIPFGRLILRRWLLIQAIGLVPYVGGLFNLADTLMIFRESRRCIHDEFAGTKVIAVKK